MDTVLPMVMFALGGLLLGGAWSLQRQGVSRGAVVLVGVLAVLATLGGALWLVSEGS